MPEEMQYRFAGFVQSEIERYAQELNELRAAHEQLLGSDASDRELETQKSKPSKKGGKGGTQSQSQSQAVEPLLRVSVKEGATSRNFCALYFDTNLSSSCSSTRTT
jgi:hypothetical protein